MKIKTNATFQFRLTAKRNIQVCPKEYCAQSVHLARFLNKSRYIFHSENMIIAHKNEKQQYKQHRFIFHFLQRQQYVCESLSSTVCDLIRHRQQPKGATICLTLTSCKKEQSFVKYKSWWKLNFSSCVDSETKFQVNEHIAL